MQWLFYFVWVTTIFSCVYYRFRPKLLAEVQGVKYETLKFEVRVVAVPPWEPLNLVGYNGILYRFEYLESEVLWSTSSYKLDSSYPGIARAEIRPDGQGRFVAYIDDRPVKVLEGGNWRDWTQR